jgi:hypothetical protein
VSEAIREDEALATDVDETSEAEVHEASGLTDVTEGDNSSEETTGSSAANEFGRSAAAAREALIAELQRTVDSVSTAVDDATARTFQEAQEEARRQADAASARVEALERDGLAKLRQLADDLLERSQWLSDQIAELTKQADTTTAEIRSEDGPAKLVAEESAAPDPFEESAPPPVEAEEFEASQEEEKPGGLGFFRRRKGPDVPEGVRLIISQMRSSGEGDREIVRHLEEMGVKDPESLVSSVKS